LRVLLDIEGALTLDGGAPFSITIIY